MTPLELWWQKHLDRKCVKRGRHKWKLYSTVAYNSLFIISRCEVCGEIEIEHQDGVHHI